MKLKIIAAAVALSAWTVSAQATYVETNEANGEDSLQTILDNLTVGGNSSIDVNTDQAVPDEVWNSTDSGLTPTRFIAEIAGNAGVNTFGIYDVNNTSNFVTLFTGGNTAGDLTAFEIQADGSVFVNLFTDTGVDFSSNNFGFFLGTPGGAFYSEAAKNGGEDQMVAYQGGNGDFLNIPVAGTKEWTSGGWIVAFEDTLYSQSDKDFNDLVVLVESATPVPEPGTLADRKSVV